jgi:hypothetical protein
LLLELGEERLGDVACKVMVTPAGSFTLALSDADGLGQLQSPSGSTLAESPPIDKFTTGA